MPNIIMLTYGYKMVLIAGMHEPLVVKHISDGIEVITSPCIAPINAILL